MKISSIFVCCALSVVIKGNMFAAAVRGGIEPIILSFGAAFAAINSMKEPTDKDPAWVWEKYSEWFKDKYGHEPEGEVRLNPNPPPMTEGEHNFDDYEDRK